MRFFCISLVVACCCGCLPSAFERSSPPTAGSAVMVVGWTNYDGQEGGDPNVAVFSIDGVSLGRGRDGFLKVLDRLRTLPQKSIVRFDFEVRIGGPGRPNYAPPYQWGEWSDLHGMLENLRIERELNFQFPQAM
jgi:hypothetical protein